MKVYVSELPKNCSECICWDENWGCNIGDFNKKTCPLLSLADYTKQVRKEVCDGLVLPLIKHFQKDAEFTVEEICKWIEEYKDQIQGEEK